MTTPALKTVTRLQGNNAALKSGAIAPAGFTLEFVEVPVLVDAFRRMVRSLEFDVCEMALTTYLCAREHGVAFTALPIFLVRAFHHGAIVHAASAPVRDPRDLEGRRVGVHRGYTVTTGVWARSVLQEEHGVDLRRVRWVLSGDEHVATYRPPPNVEPLASGSSIEDELLAGKLAAAINLTTDRAEIEPLITDPLAAGLAAFDQRGHYPINHCIVVRDEVLREHPGVAVALFEAFAESKRRYVEQLRRGEIASPGAADRLYTMIHERGFDPLPYGIEPNRRVLDELMRHALTQGILTRQPPLDALFARDTRTLAG
jgi:ABC-type nitrate/sulfonate/bicarbonate transport system substrate-binding protein